MILGAVYMLWMYQRVFLGKITNPANIEMKDLGIRERLLLLPILLMMLWIGVYSAPFLRRMDASLQLVQQRDSGARRPEGGYRVEQHARHAATRGSPQVMSSTSSPFSRMIILVLRRHGHPVAGAVHAPRAKEAAWADRSPAAAIAGILPVVPVESRRTQAVFNGMFIADNFSVFFQWLFLVITGVIASDRHRFNERESINRGEYYALLLFACSGHVADGSERRSDSDFSRH